PQNDVDALARQFVGHALYTRTAHADTGTDRVDAPILGMHRHLGAQARVARAAAQLDQALADFRHFQPEQFDQELRLATGDEQLWPTLFRAHVVEVAADAVARAHRLARNHLIARNDRFGIATEVENDRAAFHALDQTGNQFADSILVLLDDQAPFVFTNLLHDDLLGRLRGNAIKRDRLDLLFDEIVDFDVRVRLARAFQRNLPIRHVDDDHFAVFVFHTRIEHLPTT